MQDFIRQSPKQSLNRLIRIEVFTFRKKSVSYTSHIWKLYDCFFLMATQKIFQVFLKLPRIFFVFFNRNLNFILRQLFSKKKFLRAEFNVFCALCWIFFPFCLIFFSKALKKTFFFCKTCLAMSCSICDNLKFSF